MTTDEVIYNLLKKIDKAIESGTYNIEKIFNSLNFEISEKKFLLYLESMIESKYVDGFIIKQTIGGPLVFTTHPKITFNGLKFIEDYEKPAKTNDSNPVTFNIHGGTFSGNTNFGNQEHATINIGVSIDELEKLKSSLTSEDKETLEKIIQELRKAEVTQEPIKYGFFSKFSNFLSQNPVIVSTLGQVLVSYITKTPTIL